MIFFQLKGLILLLIISIESMILFFIINLTENNNLDLDKLKTLILSLIVPIENPN